MQTRGRDNPINDETDAKDGERQTTQPDKATQIRTVERREAIYSTEAPVKLELKLLRNSRQEQGRGGDDCLFVGHMVPTVSRSAGKCWTGGGGGGVFRINRDNYNYVKPRLAQPFLDTR